jgi:hypothetical protein
VPGTVFISHSTKDRWAVEHVAKLVSAQGLSVYLAEHDPQPGRDLLDKVRMNILAADAVLVLLTKSSIDSRYVHQEIGVEQDAGKLIVPLVDPDLVHEDLAMLNGAEFLVFDPDQLTSATPDLVGQLRKIADRAAVRDAVQALVVASIVIGVMYALMKDGSGGLPG